MSIKRTRIEERIHHLFSIILQREIADPRLSGISITKVTLDRELRHARVYVNALGQEDRQEEIIITLARASGYFRNAVGQSLRLKHTPSIRFLWDTTLQGSARIHELLEQIDSESKKTLQSP